MSFASKSLLSAPLGSLSHPGKLLSGSSPLSLFQTSSQHSVLSVPLSSLSGQVGSQSLSEPLKTTPQNPPVLLCKPESSSLSYPTPLLSISLSTLSQTPTSECDVQKANFLGDPLLSTSLSSLSCSQNFSLGQPSALSMSSSSSSSGKFSLGQPLASLSLSSASSSSSSSLLSQPVCPLKASQTSKAFESLSTLSRAVEIPSVEVQEEEHKHGTSDSLCQKLHNADSVGNASDSNPKEKDYNHNHKEEKKPSAISVISSTFDSSVVQEGTRSLYAIDEKPLASPIKLTVDICNARFQKKYVDRERQQTRTLDSTPPLAAKPSMFALALCYSTQASAKKPSADKPVKQNVVNDINNSSFINITPFNFCSPSPDDVVNEKQKRAFSRKK